MDYTVFCSFADEGLSYFTPYFNFDQNLEKKNMSYKLYMFFHDLRICRQELMYGKLRHREHHE